jgi:hypothetical protein
VRSRTNVLQAPINEEDPAESADPKGQKTKKKTGRHTHTSKSKNFDQPLSGNALQSYKNYSFFVFLAVDLGQFSPAF